MNGELTMSDQKQAQKDRLKKMLAYLRKASESFDTGFIGEGPRIARIILELVDDTNGPSLLTSLGLKGGYYFDMSPDYNPSIGLPFSGLAVVKLGTATAKYSPRGANPKFCKKASFDEWWSKPEIVDEKAGVNLTRQDVAVDVAQPNINEIDRNLNEAYESFDLKAAKRTRPVIKMEQMIIELPSVRHMAFELIESLNEQHPDLFETIH